jgi:glyoxylase-like metal-dependent hydrolase (beta-lactamase superfamily II)
MSAAQRRSAIGQRRSGLSAWSTWTWGSVLWLCALAAQAVEVRFERVTDQVYAFVGERGARSLANEGLNANLGLVVTPIGAVLIDSGATFQGARQVHDAARRVTDQPIRWVVNTGGQDHRWLGNGYFAAQGAEIIGHAGGQADMQARGNDHLVALRAALNADGVDRVAGTVPTLPTRWLRDADERLDLGGVRFEFFHRGGAHTPGDMLVWLPARGVLFSGDVVYVDRMLGVLPVSRTRAWLETLDVVDALAPGIIVPGHGGVTDLTTTRRDTRVYLEVLRSHMKKAVDEGVDVGAAVKSMDSRAFLRLLNAADLHPGNASRVYLEVERE